MPRSVVRSRRTRAPSNGRRLSGMKRSCCHQKSGCDRLAIDVLGRELFIPESIALELGSVIDYQMRTGTALVDTDTNELAASFTPNPPVELTREAAIAYL